MSALFIVLTIVLFILSIAMICMILMQKKNVRGFSSSLGAAADGGGYWGKNKDRSFEGQLAKYTKISATVFFVLVFLVNIVEYIVK